jgi:thioredoxin 1
VVDADVDTFDGLVESGAVMVDFWGPNCAPCIAMMADVEGLAARHAGSVRLVKVNSGDKANRPIAWKLKVMGLPTYVLMRDGVEVERLTGGDVTIDRLESAVMKLMEGGDGWTSQASA